MFDSVKLKIETVKLKAENKKLKAENLFLNNNKIRMLEKLKASGVKLCCSCNINEVESSGDWCENCRTNFAYGC